MIKVVFCYNQVSYIIAKEIGKKSNGFNLLINSDIRITRTARRKGVLEINYNSYLAFAVLLICFIPKLMEVVIPHTKGGKIVSLIAKYSSFLSFIDDGMDSFREKPKNLDLNLISNNSNYYTFNYKLPFASWLNNVKKIKVAEVSDLSYDIKPKFDFSNFETVIIESPGVKVEKIEFDPAKTFCVKHPNPNKSNLEFKALFGDTGKNIPIEKSLDGFKGRIVIGETMVLIYLFHANISPKQITVCLKESDYMNLSSLQEYFSHCEKLIIV